MAKCICGHEMARKDWKSQWVCHKCGRTKPIYECMTNADRIRAMDDEELAEWITRITDDAQLDAETKCDYQWSSWLKSEVGCE